MEELEDELLDEPGQETLAGVHLVRKSIADGTSCRLAHARCDRARLQRERHECLSEEMRPYFRDIQDHCVQIIDLNESYREIAAALTETYMSVVSTRGTRS